MSLKFCLKFHINSLPTWEILHAFLMCADFFKINFFEKIISGISSDMYYCMQIPLNMHWFVIKTPLKLLNPLIIAINCWNIFNGSVL